MELYKLNIPKLSKLIKEKEIKVKEIVEDCFKRIEKLEPKIHSFITITKENAFKKAEELDSIQDKNYINLLFGIPGTIKDIIATKNIKTTAGSKILKNYIPPYNASVVDKLLKAQIVILGKTNLDEFAHGSSTENSAFGPTKNPWDLKRVPGGSSGGSGAAVALRFGWFSIGTDTGGSIRHPASLCGVVGLKPTYGRCSRFGLLAMTSSTDVPGPITKTVEDAAIVLTQIAGKDIKDATSAPVEVKDYYKFLLENQNKIKNLKIGVIKEFLTEGLDSEIREKIEKSIEIFKNLGAEIKEVSIKSAKYGIAVYYIITPSEISSNLARYDGIKFGFSEKNRENLIEFYGLTRAKGFGDETKRRIMLGTYALSKGYYDEYYKKAQKVRTVLIQETQKVFEDVDILLAPTSPSFAFKIGEKTEDPLKMYLEDIYMMIASLGGYPAISIPCGFSKENLPCGLQLIGKKFQEEIILLAAYLFQEATNFHKKFPPLIT